jgi:hypothetical protein
MFRQLPAVLALLCFAALPAIAQPAPGAAVSPAPNAVPTQDAVAARLFAQARDEWRVRTDVPFLHYGALIRYLHNGHVFDNWWDSYARTSDGQVSLDRLVDPDEDRRRLSGVPFSIFGFTFFDTNKDAEPIRIEEPRISPVETFGLVTRPGAQLAPPPDDSEPSDAPSDAPSGAPVDAPGSRPSPQGTPLRELIRVEAERDYRITLVGTEQLRDGPALHLTLVPLRYPNLNRLRDLWIDPTTHRTMQLRVQGILNGKPYDGISWTIHYVELEGRNYLQQVVADAPLRFGFDTVIPKFEIDFVDYHFPTDVPKYTFDKPFGY